MVDKARGPSGIDTESPLDALEGRELDAAVHVTVMDLPCDSRLVGDGQSLETALRLEPETAAWRTRSPVDDYWERFSPGGVERVVIAPHYSSDIAAAMEVVEKASRQFGFAHLIQCSEGWSVSFGLIGLAVSRSLPEAICRAALATANSISQAAASASAQTRTLPDHRQADETE